MNFGARSLAYAAVGGAGAALCWLPFGLAPLMPLAMLVALRALRRVRSGREAARFGLVFGAARYAVASHFLLALLAYSPLAVAFYLLAIVSIVPWGFLEAWGAFHLERYGRLPRAVGFGLLYAAGEWLRTLGDLSFPADDLAHAFGTAPAWLGLSEFLGPFSITLLVFAVAVLADLGVEAGTVPRRAAWLLAAVALWLAPVAISFGTRHGEPVSERLRVAVVQPCIGVRDKLDRNRWPALWNRLERLTVEAAKSADLVVWPETARPGPLVWREPGRIRDREMETLAERAGVPILYGCEIARIGPAGETRLYNGAALAEPGSESGPWYGKQRLLPFAEGVPFARWIGWDPSPYARDPKKTRSVLTLLGNFTPGTEPTVFRVGPARIGVLICYEGMYASLGRKYREAGVNVLAVLTNDSWWGRSVFPSWHARMVAARARELDLPIVRAANSGVSSLTDRSGRLVASSALGEVTVLHVDVAPGPTAGPRYVRLGDAAISLALLALGVATVRGLVSWSRNAGE